MSLIIYPIIQIQSSLSKKQHKKSPSQSSLLCLRHLEKKNYAVLSSMFFKLLLQHYAKHLGLLSKILTFVLQLFLFTIKYIVFVSHHTNTTTHKIQKCHRFSTPCRQQWQYIGIYMSINPEFIFQIRRHIFKELACVKLQRRMLKYSFEGVPKFTTVENKLDQIMSSVLRE